MIHTTQEYQIGDNVELMREMSPDSIDTIVTSPPYWGLRDYGVDGQIGLEPTLEEYHSRMLEVTAECMRVLKPTGVMFWNHGDSYGGSGGSGGDYAEGGLREGQPKVGKGGGIAKCMTMQNERLIIKMVDNQGWILRNRIIWSKSNGMPSSVSDRFSNKYEPVYMLTKNRSYWFDLDAVRKPYTEPMNRWGGQKLKADGDSKYANGDVQGGYRERDMRPNPLGKNPGDVVEMTQVEWINHCHDLWDMFAEEQGDIIRIPTQPYPESHFATFPTALIEPMIKAACPEGGTVLDPFCGSGTVLEVCRLLNRNAIGLELNPEYEPLIKERSMAHTPPLTAY